MIRHYLTLAAVTHEAHRALEGSHFIRAFSGNKDELTILFEHGENFFEIVFSTLPTRSLFYIRETKGKRSTKKPTKLFFLPCTDARVQSVLLHPSDRFVRIDFTNHLHLALVFYGKPNALLLSEKFEVKEHFKNDRPERLQIFSSTCAEDFLQMKSWEEFVRDVPLASLPFRNRNELLKKKAYLAEQDNGTRSFSLFPPSDGEYKEFDQVSEALENFIRESEGSETFRRRMESVHSQLKHEQERILHALAQLHHEETREARAHDAETTGKLIVGSLGTIKRGQKEVALKDFETGEERVVKLNPAFSPQENAAVYFLRAKRSRERAGGAEKRRALLAARFEKNRSLEQELQKITTTKELSSLILAHAWLRGKDSSEKKKNISVPYRRFTAPGGGEIWVGRNAKQNDELTMRHSRKTDLFFHARGVSGAHVILRIDGPASKEAITRAAELAAYFSDAKTSSLVPVAYAEKKYVRKPRGAAPGAVVMEREKTIDVTPRLYEEIVDQE